MNTAESGMFCLAILVGAAATATSKPTVDACDARETATALLSMQISLPGCPEPFDDEELLTKSTCVQSASNANAAHAVCLAVRRHWWGAAKVIERVLDSPSRLRARAFVQTFKSGAAGVIALIIAEGRYGSDMPLVLPAVQWAQTVSQVNMLVRFSPKKHGPVSVSTVEEPEVALNETHVCFTAFGRPHSRAPIRFELRLPMHAPISHADSSWTIAKGGGRLTLVLQKAENASWPHLAAPAADGERRGHIGTWYEMQACAGRTPRGRGWGGE